MLWLSFALWTRLYGNWTIQTRVFINFHWTPFVFVQFNPNFIQETSRVLMKLDWLLGNRLWWRVLRKGHWEYWKIRGTMGAKVWLRSYECSYGRPPQHCYGSATCEDHVL